MKKTQGNFTLSIEAGEFNDSEIIVLLGENGTGKTTFIRMLAGMLQPDEIDGDKLDEFATLSGGELQRVAITMCLGQPANVYLIDEPSAYLDSEQRIMAAKVIKRYIMHTKKTAFIVEHDFIMSAYLADRVIVYEGQPSKDAVAKTPETLLSGMNRFLKNLEITFRRDPTNYRPRINKKDSLKEESKRAWARTIILTMIKPMCNTSHMYDMVQHHMH
eukprot:jgi/Picre1/31170/NNA_006524.t1